jgi:hypothetical protein
VTWSLVFDEDVHEWLVEKIGPQTECVRLTLAEFEKSDAGKQLGSQLSAALNEARDARRRARLAASVRPPRTSAAAKATRRRSNSTPSPA